MEDVLRVGFYILVLIPGFIFVQTKEYHLLRERHSQFEKTLDMVLYSAGIWIIASAIPAWVWWPLGDYRQRALLEAAASLRLYGKTGNLDWSKFVTMDWAIFFGTICLWALLGATLWGWFRKSKYADSVMRFVTGRDWYPSAAQRFFVQNIDRAVVVATPETRYLGILFAAPDTKEDPHIILSEVSRLPKPGTPDPKIERLPLVRWVLIRFDQIVEIQALTTDALESRIGLWTQLTRKIFGA